MDNNSINNPVFDVYDQYRTARLNVRYLEKVLKRLRRNNFLMEFFIAISASSSAATIWFFQGHTGEIIWKILTSITALLAIAKPLMKLSDKIKYEEEMFTSYKVLDFDLQRLVFRIREKQCYDEELKLMFGTILDRRRELVKMDKGTTSNERLLEQCYQKVLKELPVDGFYIPSER